MVVIQGLRSRAHLQMDRLKSAPMHFTVLAASAFRRASRRAAAAAPPRLGQLLLLPSPSPPLLASVQQHLPCHRQLNQVQLSRRLLLLSRTARPPTREQAPPALQQLHPPPSAP